NATTRSAIDLPLFWLQRMQPRDELAFRHATDLEIEAQEIRVDQRRDLAHVVFQQRLADVRLDLVALEHCGHVGAIFGGKLRILLQIEEELAHPVIGHRPSRAYFIRFLASSTMLRSVCFLTSGADFTKPRSRVMSTLFCSAARSGIMSGS